MKRRNKGMKTRPNEPPEFQYDLSIMKPVSGDHEKFKQNMIDGAIEVLDGFPDIVEEVKNIFRKASPLQTIACFSSYASSRFVGSDGVEPQKNYNDVEQYHCEFFQALLLTLPVEEWGQNPVTPDVVQKLFDVVPKLSAVTLAEAIASTPEGMDEKEFALESLQQQIKLHTKSVRNWGYFQDVVQISREILAPLDERIFQYHGFNGNDLLDVLLAVIKEFEKRKNIHFSILRKVARGKNYRQIFRLYFKHVPDLSGTAEDLISKGSKGLSKDQALLMVTGHFDLRHSEQAIFSPKEIANASGVDNAVVSAVFNSISFLPGDLENTEIDFLFLGNPIWNKPGIKIGDDKFFFAMPQVAFSHINKLIDRLTAEAKIRPDLEKRRAEFLEEKLLSVVKKALPSANIKSGVKWKIGHVEYETDLLVVQDRVVLIGEAKSHRLTPEGLRGAPKRIKRHIKDLVIAPSLQSFRLEKLIDEAKRGDENSLEIVQGLGIDPKIVDRVIRFSATLDDLSVLSAAEPNFKKLGWLPEDHKLAPAILISDLSCIVEILDNPLIFYHYLSERYHLQKSFNLLGDELDFLGLYLVSGFNLGKVQQEKMLFMLTGMSAPVDRYFESQSVGQKVLKPKVELGQYFGKVVERLSKHQPDGWTTVGLHLLSCADPKDQREIDRNIRKIKTVVRKNYRDHEHLCSIQIRPPEDRKALVILHFFPEQLKHQMRTAMEQLVRDAMEESGIETCALISQNINNKHQPYEAAALVVRN